VRVGGLGNRKLGHRNGIAEDSCRHWTAARTACVSVLDAIEKLLVEIHQDLPPQRGLHHWPSQPPWWKTHGLGWLFGQADRWGWARYCGTSARVFTAERPLISLLSGDAAGADRHIRRLAMARRKISNHPVDYELLRVTPEAPGSVSDGLGVGLPAPKNPALQTKVAAKQSLTRAEANEQSAIVRRRAQAYRAQSEALRHHSDVLLAIWDPDTEGKAGGTAESVEAALREHIPVIAIRLTGPDQAEIHLLESLRHLRHLQGKGGTPPSADWENALKEVLTYLLAFPDPGPKKGKHKDSHHGEAPTAYDPRHAFAAYRADEPLRRLWPDRLWKWFDPWCKVRAVESLLETETDAAEKAVLEKDLEKTQEKLVQAKRLGTLIGPAEPLPMPAPSQNAGAAELAKARYERVRKRASSEGMSGVYGDAHRGGIILSYWLAALAVLLAAAGGLMHVWHWSAWWQAGAAVLEVAAIFTMWALHESSKTDEWNAAYTDARILSEALRMMKSLAPLGVHTPLPRLPCYLRKSEDAAHPDRLWSIWYFRALVRMSPLRLPDGRSLDAARQGLRDDTHADQRRYHSINAHKQELLHHRIERVVPWLFTFVGFCALLHFFDVACLHWPLVFEFCLVFCVGGPALIAALHGFASQMECQRLQLRSSSMKRLLEERSEALAALDLSKPDSAEAVWGLATEALATASVLMEETVGWSMLYRNTDIPAG